MAEGIPPGLKAREVPLFVPTSAGRVFGIVTLPEGDVPLLGRGVVLLPGGRAGAGVLPLFQSIARRLAEGGQPVFRFDYPGAGLSAGVPAVPKAELPALVNELCGWFVGETGAEELAVAGRCGGGRVALALPRLSPLVTASVAAVPFVDMGGWSLRSKIAALDAKGPRLVRRLVQAPRPERAAERSRSREELEAEFVEDLHEAATRARITVVFGEHDELRTRFDGLLASADVSPEGIEMVVLPDARLHGLPNVEHERQLGETLFSRLVAPAIAHG